MDQRRLAIGAGLAVAAMLAVTQPTLAQADPADAGDVVVADPVNVNRALTEGESTSAFTLLLPDGAACPGDSANDDWRVQSFLVPADTDIGSLQFRALRPDGDAYRSLRYLDGDIYVMEFTSPNEVSGEPGQILSIPPLTMAWFETGSLTPGPYRMGIACTPPSWEVEKYWDVGLELESAPEVEPGGLRWRVVASTNAEPLASPSGSSTPWIAPLAVLIVVVGGIIGLRRHRNSTPQSQKEAA
jgi:hypothetical protein